MTPEFYHRIQNYKRTIDYNATFLLLGSRIDGYVSILEEEFANFEDLESRLPHIMMNFRAEGEWEISLYQVYKPYKIYKRYECIQYPKKGKLIFKHSYMDYKIKKFVISKKCIHIICMYLELEDEWRTRSEYNVEYDVSFELFNYYLKQIS
ncbi:MAG: hypothetical protein GW772_13055 [Flavobacteriia bacterium]|nr:hypothetical protein [Flavobacteriia bacterium]OIP46489.1 MAG: hypothetical protein AUK46_08065 [Flavobacteriaceae bacterium CG2_30_31_66]PIV97022.1 MAG: hypothetical protein COW43_05270 [Flavobacteriaceae bacterium CG17_big_fil_post_rev_8_21_14_2_50_31_13]PIX12107.1 MAG: hypothetical protein COZ74_12270 [Flavobacteriaceae bacterium CG_4_8_14_3_um_filter_31_8]PIY16351.1 MAG: hypothetical protein COZ16_00390 [Flavobacteriaceae bacterium CG_4_10_14_3_um_filter_31_253]PIZ12226.1 MAG: hypotheti